MQSNLLKYFIIILFLIPFNTHATGLYNVGLGPFAIQHENFDCKGFFEEIKPLKELHIAILFNTFGNNNSCLIKLLQDERLVSLEIHLINEPCHRNKRCGSYEFLAGIPNPGDYEKLWRTMNSKLIKKFTNYVRPLQRLLNNHALPTTEILISPGLESNIWGKAASNLIKTARRLFPGKRIVWNPLAASSSTELAHRRGSDILEGHGSTPRIKAPCTANLDGTDIDFPERPVDSATKDAKNYVESGRPLQQYIETYANMCEVVYLWVAEYNCGGGTYGRFMDPRKRPCKDVRKLTRLLVKEIIQANKYGKAAPLDFIWTEEDNSSFKGCSSIIEHPADGPKLGFLLKQSEFRNRGGVVLLPGNNIPTSLEIVSKGKVIDKYTFTGYYHGQPRQLWRSNKTPLSYRFKAVLKAKYKNKTVCYRLNNPRVRID